MYINSLIPFEIDVWDIEQAKPSFRGDGCFEFSCVLQYPPYRTIKQIRRVACDAICEGYNAYKRARWKCLGKFEPGFVKLLPKVRQRLVVYGLRCVNDEYTAMSR